MSQQRTRKAVGAEPVSRSRAATKASGNVASNVQPKQRQRSRSKTKIPKMLRYDLENALVGLCDVWFGEIKPHLVRNNIKLHAHWEPTREEPASGDHTQLPLGAPGCSHIDPGAASDLPRHLYASFADFCSTQPTASRAQSRRPPALPPPCPSQVSSPVKHHTSFYQNSCQSCKPKKRRRRCRREAPLPQPEWRVPRLCRTYSLLTHTPRALPRQRPATEYHLKHQPRQRLATEHHHQHQPRQLPATEHHLQHQPRQRSATEHYLQHQPRQRPATEHHLQHQPRQRSATEHYLQHQPRQRPATEHHLHHQYKYSPLYQRPKMIDKSTQTTSLRFLELHQTRPQAPPTGHLQNSSAPPRMQHKKRRSAKSTTHQFYFPDNDLRTQEIPQQMRFSDPTAASIRCSGTRTLLPNQRSRQTKHQPSNPIHEDAELRAGNAVDLTRRVPPVPCPQSLQSNAFTTRKQNKKRQSIQHHYEFAVQDLAVRRELSQGTASSRCPATTTLSKHQKRHPQPPPALFQDDLIDIIAEKKDKKLRLLFKSPPHDEIPSIMNLMHPVHARCNPKTIKKPTPWR